MLDKIVAVTMAVIMEVCGYGVDYSNMTPPSKYSLLENRYDAPDFEYRPSFNVGKAKRLYGRVKVYPHFVDDPESSWTQERITEVKNTVLIPGLRFIEEKAKEWGVTLEFKLCSPSDSMTVKISEPITDVDEGYLDYMLFVDRAYKFKAPYMNTTEDSVHILLVNKEGRSFSVPDYMGNRDEWTVIFACDERDVTVAHEVLHLFGADDFYEPSLRAMLARKHYRTDIMLSTGFLSKSTIGEVTAYQVGWTDEIPEILKNEDWWREDEEEIIYD